MSKLDILIPVYNEGLNIIPVVEGLRAAVKTPFQILICYDRDEDNTLAALRNYKNPEPKVIFVKNEGQGAHGAVMTGFRASKAPAVIVFPADDTHNGGIIDRMFELFEKGAHIVAASRFMRGGCMEGCPWLKAFLVRTSAFILYHLARIPTHDPSNGFRLFSRRVIENIPVESHQGFAFSIELLVKCHRLGWQISEVPARWFERKKGKSRFRLFEWLPLYLQWFFYAFATPWHRLRRKA